MLKGALTLGFLLLAATAWADCVADIQAQIDACTKGGCEVTIAPQTCELGGGKGLVVDKPGIRLRAAAGWSQVGVGVVFKATSAVTTMLAVKNAQGFVLEGIEFDCHGQAREGVAFAGPVGGGVPSYSVIERFRIHGCATGLVVGRQTGRDEQPVVGLSVRYFRIDVNGTGIQQNGADTGDIAYTDGAITDNRVVGFDMGNSQGAVFRMVSSNGRNGPGGDFRCGHPNNAALSIYDSQGNPVQGPYVNCPFLAPSLHATQVLIQQGSISWNGPSGGRIINYQGYGGVTMIGGSIGGDGVIHVSPHTPVSQSGPNFTDIGVQFYGNPEPRVTVTGGRRFEILPIHRNTGLPSGIRGHNLPIGGP
jgi:hypothetical protein